MKKIAPLLAVLSLATACVYPFQPDFENENVLDDILVVDGNILIGEVSTVRISFMSNMWPKKVDPAAGLLAETRASSPEKATVWIVPEYAKDITAWAEDDGGKKYEAILDTESLFATYAGSSYVPGLPYTISTEEAPAERSYRLCVQVKDQLYTSDWVKPMAPPVLKKVSFKSSKSDVTVCATLDGGADATGYVLLTFDETWRFHAERYPNYDYDPNTNSVSERVYPPWDRYWCWMSSDEGTQVPVDYTGMTSSSLKEYPIHHFSRYDNRNHQRYSIRVKARTINKDTYLYLSHLEENSQAGGNLFSPNPGEVAGNLRCETDPERMVLGFVTVARSTSLRAFLDSRYLLSRVLSPYELAYPLQWGQGEENPGWPEYYRMGYMPVEPNELPDPDPNFGPFGWASAPCYDCIAAGGTQEKPDFWDD